MASPARFLRTVMAGAIALSAVLRPGLAAAQFTPGDTLIRDTEIEEILHRQSAPIFAAAGIDPKGIQIVLVGSKDPNAAAAPGVMMVTTSLIMQADNPNQLQGVIGHEIGHLAGGHSFRSGEGTRAGMVPMILTMGLGVLAAIAGAGDAAAGLISSAPMFGGLGYAAYSREQESRADQAGATLLEKAGLSGRGLAEFFDKYRYQEVFSQARRYKYFIDHPLFSDRIEALQVRVASLPHYYVKDSPEALAEHEIMKAKLEGFIEPQVALTKYDEKDEEGSALPRADAALRQAPGRRPPLADLFARGAAEVRRLPGDQPDRGPGRHRRELGQVDPRAEHRGHGA